MPTRKYALERGGIRKLEISWRILWKNITVRLDGKEIGSIANQKELIAGREFSLIDGSILKVKLIQGFAPELQVTKNGQAIPGSDSGLALEPAGYGKLSGIIIGGATFGKLGSIAGSTVWPGVGTALGGITFGIIGGTIGGSIGSKLDDPSAGYLNYNEY